MYDILSRTKCQVLLKNVCNDSKERKQEFVASLVRLSQYIFRMK
jgi:hypothetical protein